MKKLEVTLDIYCQKQQRKAMKVVSSICGVDSVSMDTKGKKLTVTGEDFDPVEVVRQLRKTWHADIVTVGPAKEPEKKDTNKEPDVAEMVKLYKDYNPYMTQHYVVCSAEENPNSCVIL